MNAATVTPIRATEPSATSAASRSDASQDGFSALLDKLTATPTPDGQPATREAADQSKKDADADGDFDKQPEGKTTEAATAEVAGSWLMQAVVVVGPAAPAPERAAGDPGASAHAVPDSREAGNATKSILAKPESPSEAKDARFEAAADPRDTKAPELAATPRVLEQPARPMLPAVMRPEAAESKAAVTSAQPASASPQPPALPSAAPASEPSPTTALAAKAPASSPVNPLNSAISAAAQPAALPTEADPARPKVAATARPTTESPQAQRISATVPGKEAAADGRNARNSERHPSSGADTPFSLNTPPSRIESAQSGRAASQAGPTVAERAAVVEQVSHRIETMRLTTGRQELTMHLSPEHLGDLRLTVVADRQSVTAHVVAETQVARQALQEGRDQLRSALEQRGFTLAGLDVALGQSTGGQRDRAPAFDLLSRPPRAQTPESPAVAPAAASAPARRAWRPGGVDLDA